MALRPCSYCGEPVGHLFGRRVCVPARAGSAAATQVVWLCRDCRTLHNSPAYSCLLFLVGTLLILISVPAGVGALLGLIRLLNR